MSTSPHVLAKLPSSLFCSLASLRTFSSLFVRSTLLASSRTTQKSESRSTCITRVRRGPVRLRIRRIFRRSTRYELHDFIFARYFVCPPQQRSSGQSPIHSTQSQVFRQRVFDRFRVSTALSDELDVFRLL